MKNSFNELRGLKQKLTSYSESAGRCKFRGPEPGCCTFHTYTTCSLLSVSCNRVLDCVLCVYLSNRAAAVDWRCGGAGCQMAQSHASAPPPPWPHRGGNSASQYACALDTAPQQQTTARVCTRLVLNSQHNKPRGLASTSAFYDLLGASLTYWMQFGFLSNYVLDIGNWTYWRR